jgi:hypothetical protein
MAIKTPPFPSTARTEAAFLLRWLQRSEKLGLPESRPMPAIGLRCDLVHFTHQQTTWRLIYLLEADVIVILEVFRKPTRQTA